MGILHQPLAGEPWQETTKNLPDEPSLSLLWTRDFALLFSAHLLFGLALWPYVLFPVHLQNLGADPFEVGLLMGAASFSGVLIRPFIGHWLDRKGRKPILLMGGVIFFFPHILYVWIHHLGEWLLGARLLYGAGMGILMATFFTIAVDLSPPSRRVGGIALFGISGQISGAIGVPLGERMVQTGGFSSLFVFCAVMSALALFVSLLIRETAEIGPKVSSEAFWKKEVFKRILLVPLFTTFTFSMGLTSYMVFLKPYLRTVGFDRVAYFFLAYTVTAISVRLLGGDWPDRHDPQKILYSTLFSMAIGIFLLVLFPSRVGLIASGILCGVGHGLAFPILSVLVVGRSGELYRGGSMALYTLVFDLGGLVGPPLFGWIVREFSYKLLYLTAAVLILMGVAALAWLDHEKEKFSLT